MENEKVFMNIDEIAAFLSIDTKDIRTMIANESIPFLPLPSGHYVFHRLTILDWALGLNPARLRTSQSPSSLSISPDEDRLPVLVETILNRFRYSHKRTKSDYVNLYKSQKVFAQLHFPSTCGGVDLALCECGNDSKLPETKILTRFQELWKLHGYVRNNKPWLEGTRLSSAPAAAFNIPAEIGHDNDHDAWSEIDQLLTYSFNKR